MSMALKIKKAIVNSIVVLTGVILGKNRAVVLFGSWMGEKYADNSRFLFQYLSSHKKELGIKEVIWATRLVKVKAEVEGLGYKCVLIGTKESYYWHCKAGIHIICNSVGGSNTNVGDIDTALSAGAIKIQLWHGNGIKCVPGNHSCDSRAKYLIKKICSNGGWVVGNYYFLCKNDIDIEFFKRKFGAEPDKCIDGAYPRTCACEKYTLREQNIINTLRQYSKVVLYLPTFREKYSNFVHPLSDNRVLSYLEMNNILWIEKPHSADKNSESISTIKNANVLTLESSFDINVLIPLIDLLVTDYSSAMLDALYFRKQVLYYVPDYEYYIKDDRGFLMNYDSVCINPKVESIDAFFNSLLTITKLNKYDEHAENIRRQFWKYNDWTCGDIWKAIMDKCFNPTANH